MRAEFSQVRETDRSDGFTLTEILVAILITGIIAGVIYSSYIGGLRIIAVSQEDIERTSMARLLLDRTSRDISCAFLRDGKAYLIFVGSDMEGDGAGADTLTFIAADHERSSRDAPESALSEVGYFLDPGPKGELFIVRREDPTLDDDPFSGGETQIIGEGVAGMDFEYLGEDGWVSSWDSRETISLPLAARVTIVMRTEEEGGGEAGEEAARYTTFSVETAIPLGGSWEEAEPTPTPNVR